MLRAISNKKKITYVLWISIILFLILMLRRWSTSDYPWWLIFLSVNFIYLSAKLVFALRYTAEQIDEEKQRQLKEKNFTVAAVLPFYNEDTASVLKALDSLQQQTYPIHQIIFVDDGSSSLEAYHCLSELAAKRPAIEDGPQLKVIRLDSNQGKKAAQTAGIEQVRSELLLLVDSDGEISSNAVQDMLVHFLDERIGGVVGKIIPRNFDTNFLTRMQDIIYTNAFQLGRRMQAWFGSVIVCSGALSMFRTEIIKENSALFSKERFLGLRCVSGDDRLLTLITLKEGYQTVYQDIAVCATDVPTKLKKYLKQQIRWQKSGLLLTIFSFKYLYKRPLCLLFQIMESYLWLINLVIAAVLFFTVGIPINGLTILIAVLYSFLVYYLSCLFYSLKSVFWYAIGFIFSFVYSFLLIIIRIYALLTIGISRWGTR